MCGSSPQQPKVIKQPPVTFEYVPTPTPVNKQQKAAAAIQEEQTPQGASLGAGGLKGMT